MFVCAEYSTWSETLQRFMGVGLYPTGEVANDSHPEANNANSAIKSEPSDAPTAVFPSAMDVPLPDAPSLSIFCLYGHGKPTERSFHYTLPNVTSPKTNSANSHTTDGGEGGQDGKGCEEGGGGGGKLTDDGSVRTAVGKPAGKQAGSADDILGSFDWRFFTDLHQPENRLVRERLRVGSTLVNM